MFSGILDLPVWGLVVITLVLTHITIAAVTIFLHRNQAHRALDLHSSVSHFFRLWLWLTTGMVTKEWVAVHRKHHAKCETEEDPHSPKIKGVNHILWGGVHYYRKEAANPKTIEDYGLGTPNDWVEKTIYTPYNGYGVLVMLLIDILLFGIVAGPIMWAVQMVWIPFLAAGVINGIGHYFGYRNYSTPDTSTNIVPWGILIGGEELHNNHHAYASSAKFSTRWYELDIAWYYIKTLQFFGLAKVKKVAPKPILDPSKQVIDMDALKAIIAHRFQVMSNYGRSVISPILKSEISGNVSKSRNLLIQDDFLMDEDAKTELKKVLDTSEMLKTVYQFKQRLQEIWKRTTQSQDQLLQALQEWCKQAEATGIKALQDFARTLSKYSQVQYA